MPLAYASGHVGCSFGEDRVIIDGVEWVRVAPTFWCGSCLQ